MKKRMRNRGTRSLHVFPMRVNDLVSDLDDPEIPDELDPHDYDDEPLPEDER